MPAWLGWVAVLLLALYLAIYPALAAWGACAVQTFVAPAKGDRAAPAFAGATWSFILAFAALWVLTEWLRSWLFTGFAWNPLGAVLIPTMIPNLFLPIVGTYGFSAVIVALAAWTGWAALWLARSRSWSRPNSGTWVGLGFLAIFLWSLIATRSEEHTSELQSLMSSSYAVFCL